MSQAKTSTHFTKAHLLGEVAWLMAHSELHHKWPVGALQQWVATPLLRGQFRLYHQANGQPVGYVSWAFFNEDAELRYQKDSQAVQPADWNSGDRLWVIDFVAPFGHGKKIVNDLATNIFPSRTGKALRIGKNGRMRVIEMTGKSN